MFEDTQEPITIFQDTQEPTTVFEDTQEPTTVFEDTQEPISRQNIQYVTMHARYRFKTEPIGIFCARPSCLFKFEIKS